LHYIFLLSRHGDILFHPLQNLDLAHFYDLNHSWVDFFIFLILFSSVAKLTIGRRFEGREGRILAGVIGLILALSLTLMEMRVDFSLRSFGAIAAGILIFLVGLVIFYLIKSVNAGYSAAGAISFIITYFLIRATVPNFFLWIEENQWAAWVHLGLVLALIVSFWKVVSSFWSRGSIKSWGRSLERSHDLSLSQKDNIDGEKYERSVIKSRLEKITKKGIKNGKEIVENLKEIGKIIDEFGDTDRGRRLISEKIRDIASRENLMMNQLESLKQISERVESFDLKAFKDLKTRWDKVPDKEKSIVKEEILIEKDKILSEEKLREMESEVMRYDKDFRYSLNMAVASLRSNQPNEARDWVSKAIKAEEEAVNILKEMKSLEDRLLKLTKMEFRTLKKEVKEEK
jgi:hypothetical protein